jgi:hypothetical protein
MANDWEADMTLEDMAVIRRTPPWACACCGPPTQGIKRGDYRCFCALRMDQVQSLHRAAHIVAKLMLSATEKKAGKKE